MSFALLFPGQGAQYAGMGRELYETYPQARSLFDSANSILGFSISDLCFNGPEDQLNLTINSQPAIFVTSLATWAVLKASYPELVPAMTCGLSLGEFSALTAAGALEFEVALRLVRKRGQWMHEAGSQNPGAMCSVIGLDEAGCDSVAAAAGVQVANYNSPEQIVLSGTQEGIDRVMSLAKEKGAKKVIPLKVSGAFHSNLMKTAQDKLAEELKKTSISEPKIRFIPNVTAAFTSSPEDIRGLLARQVTSSVRWTHSVRLMHSQGIRIALEMGPGKVLKGLAKRTLDDFTVHSVETAADVKAAASFFNESTV